MTLDLDRYFERIGWADPVPPTMQTLAGLVRAHTTSIPFENLDVLLGKPPSLELDALQAKLVDAKRGGYCYEHATLMQAVLVRLGFEVRAHSARVIVTTPKHAAPRTHMFLSVELPEGGFVVDPGFGGLAPQVPVPLDGTEAGDHWIERDAGDWILKIRTPDRGILDGWVARELATTPDYPIDFVMANHFTATHPHSHFTQRLMMRAFTVDGKLTVMNRDVTELGVTSQLADRAALHHLLVERFGFDLDVTGLRIPSVPEWA